ncbi:LysR family transcriptional regulator [Burkholderia sp. Bp8963]|uniref:LysR family transcriptional regulator n=1 Tax=Burkholderia sp. Bp8963 TaxID=2184547 RepID=UPI000F5A0BE0|nr:LysR family transcriptional regulator [Burkholderia sp. Bp8963]RQS67009.1 LysR family transcriptional regulator [Burkholderia sp. Bp8963]
MVDLNDVALFVCVASAGSFAEAARRLGLPANTASRRVQELERELGVRLMQRSTRRLVLTDAGQRLFSQCADQIESVERSTQEIAEGTATPSGRVRVALPADFFHVVPAAIMSEFLAAYPRVRLEFVLSDARADLLGENIDVAFRVGKAIEPNLIARQIGWTSAGLVASPAYLEVHGEPDAPPDLSDHDCIAAPSNPTGYTIWRLDGPDGPIEVAVRGRFHVNSMQVQLDAARSGLGIALLPTAMVAGDVAAGRLSMVLPEYGLHRVGVYLVYLNRRQLPRAVSAFIEFTAVKLLETKLVVPLASKA